MISVIIPVYNEGRMTGKCISSLSKQTERDMEIIVVDDGSSDNLKFRIKNLACLPARQELRIKRLRIFTQKHQGPGVARNLGAKYAKGDILVFVDADMIFQKDFIEKLIAPIREGKSKGTFTKEEYVSNWENAWARCWNYKEGIGDNCKIPRDYPLFSPVFRAIQKTEFLKVKGFDNIGFTDDWTLSRKLKYQATAAPGAVCYHQNPATLKDVYRQARWVGKNEFISGNVIRKILSLLRFNIITQLIRSLFITARFQETNYIIFSIVYYWGISVSVLFSFLGESKNK